MILLSLLFFYFGVLALVLLGALRDRNFFSFRVLLWSSLGLVYVLPLVVEPRPTWAEDGDFLLLILIGLAGFAMAMVFLDRAPGSPGTLICNTAQLDQHGLSMPVIRFLTGINVVFLLFGITRALPSFNPQEVAFYLISDRVDTLYENPLSTSALFLFLKRILTSATLLFVFHAWRRGRKIGTLVYLILLLDLIITSHTRFVILTALFYPILFIHFFKRRFGPGLIVGLVLGSVALLSLGNFVRGGYFQDNSRSGGISELVSPEVALNQLRRSASFSTDYFYSIYKMVDKGPEEVEFGLQYFQYLPIAPVPRIFWPDKPTISYFHRATEMIEGRPPGVGNQKVYTTTILGEAYHQFSLPGVFLAPFVYVLLILFLLRVLQRLQYSDILFWSIILHIPMDMRGGMFSITINSFTNLVFIALIFMVGYGKRRRVSSKNTFLQYV